MFFVLVALGPATHGVARAQQTDVIRGTIVGSDSQPLRDVNVKATSYQGGIVKTAKTGKDGRFTIVVVNGEGDYWIDLTKVGYSARRYEVRRIGDEEVLLANARMSDAAAKLGAVEVVARRERQNPPRSPTDPDAGGGDRDLSTAIVSVGQEGNLAAMASGMAGFQMIPGLDGASDAFSALGLSGDQNNTTFAGLGSGVTALPPDILATTSIRPYPFDVSVGGFSGAQVSIQSLPGTNFSRRAMSSAGIAPPTEFGTDEAVAQGQQFTSLRLGGNAAGPIVVDRAFYNVAYNAQRRFSDLQTILNTGPRGLISAGVAPDSVARLAGILDMQAIPTASAGVPGLRTIDVAQLSANVDLMPSGSGAGHSFTIGGAGNVQRSTPVSRGSLLLGTATHTGETSFWGANATLTHSNYFGFGILSRTTLGLAASGSSTSPYAAIPEGNVRVASSLPDGTTSVKTLFFGGGAVESSLANQSVQFTNQLSWFSANNRHAFKLTASAMRDAFHSDVRPSRFGTFSYNSLADLEAGQPASFTRTLGFTARDGAQWSGAMSLGDSWRPTDGLQVQYGLRVDGNRFLDRPGRNDALFDVLHVDNTAVPNRVYLSPRIGMQWYYGRSPEIEYAPGSARPPRAVIHAGVGVFQNVAAAQFIASAIGAAGLATSTQSVACLGAAIPAANWAAFVSDQSAIPDRCADGSSGGVFSTRSPGVVYFDRGFRQPRSVRGAADWSGPILDNRFVLGVQTILTSGLAQQGQLDVNLDTTARFSLSAEGGRPVFADPAAIVPATGAIAIAGSRVSPAYQHVWRTVSTFSVPSMQLSVNFKPVTANPRLRWEATYTRLDARESFSGFTSTAGNPFAIERGPTLQRGRHTVLLRWQDFPVLDVVYLSTFVQFLSGQRYTPMVAGDVNGDGLLNDRAFVADPATLADPTESASMRSLLATSAPSVRDCLTRSMNRLASRGSCRTPWTTNSAMLVKFNPQKIGLPKRASVTFVIQNTLALADLALHGSDRLRGWGQVIPPDQNLLFVRGFDADTRRFRYEVNQRFGSTRPQQSAVYAMPNVTLQLSFDIGVPRERQLLTQRLDVGRSREGTRLTPIAFAQFGLASIPNPMLLILRSSDSLGLSRAQADSLADLIKAFGAFADSVWLPFGREIAALPERYSAGDAFARYSAARARSIDYLIGLVPTVKAVLTPAQQRKLPPLVANYLDVRVLSFLRTSSAGDASAVTVRR